MPFLAEPSFSQIAVKINAVSAINTNRDKVFVIQSTWRKAKSGAKASHSANASRETKFSVLENPAKQNGRAP